MSKKLKQTNDRRVAIFRLLKIANAIYNRPGITASVLAKELETSVRTIGRDIEFLRDSLKHPIDYDPVGHQYRYTRRPLSITSPGNKALI